MSSDFPLEQLSSRELMVLNLAINGRTDKHIALELGISVCSVNTYWMRIRSKLGKLNRTEIVAKAIRRQALLRMTVLQEENARLIAEAQKQIERMQSLRDVLASLRKPTWQPFALANLPAAALVTAPPSNVVYANMRALRLYSAGPEGLEGLPLRELSADSTLEPFRELLERSEPTTEILGNIEPYFALRRDGSCFRALMKAERFETPDGPFAALIVREFQEEASQQSVTVM